MPGRRRRVGRTIVYRLKLRPTGSAAARRAILNHAGVIEQLRLGHQLHNALVAIEREHDEAWSALWSEDPAVAAAEKALAAAEEALAVLVDRAKQEHTEDRSTTTRSHTAAEITAARQTRREAAAMRKHARALAPPPMKAREHALNQQRQAKIKATYADFVQTRGLYWATYNRIKDHHLVAVNRVMKARQSGQRAQLRFKRWDGTGSISVQLQRQPGDPLRSPQLLASGEGKWRNVLRFSKWMDPQEWQALPMSGREAAARMDVIWQLGNRTTVTLPVQATRMIPPDADIARADLTFTGIGATRRGVINVTAVLPDPTPVEGPPVAVHVGWRKRDDGSVRVATLASPQPLTPPTDLAVYVQDMIQLHAGNTTGEIIVPARWFDDLTHSAGLRSVRDKELRIIAEQLAEWLDKHPQPDPADDEPDRMLTGTRIRQWRSAARFAALALHWRETPPTGPGANDQGARLEAWRKQDKHLWCWEVGQRENFTLRRNTAYQLIAHWLTDAAGAVVTDDSDLATLRRRDDIADDGPALPGERATAARRRAAFASPGTLRATIVQTAKRRGAVELRVSSQHLSRHHRRCGHTADPHPRYAAAAVVMCPHCGNMYDQDLNAAQLMLDRCSEGQDAS